MILKTKRNSTMYSGFYLGLLFLLFYSSPVACILEKHRCLGQQDGLYRHPDDCGLFVRCFAGYAYEHKCSADLHFHEAIGVCDHPINARCSVAGDGIPDKNMPFSFKPIYKDIDYDDAESDYVHLAKPSEPSETDHVLESLNNHLDAGHQNYRSSRRENENDNPSLDSPEYTEFYQRLDPMDMKQFSKVAVPLRKATSQAGPGAVSSGNSLSPKAYSETTVADEMSWTTPIPYKEKRFNDEHLDNLRIDSKLYNSDGDDKKNKNNGDDANLEYRSGRVENSLIGNTVSTDGVIATPLYVKEIDLPKDGLPFNIPTFEEEYALFNEKVNDDTDVESFKSEEEHIMGKNRNKYADLKSQDNVKTSEEHHDVDKESDSKSASQEKGDEDKTDGDKHENRDQSDEDSVDYDRLDDVPFQSETIGLGDGMDYEVNESPADKSGATVFGLVLNQVPGGRVQPHTMVPLDNEAVETVYGMTPQGSLTARTFNHAGPNNFQRRNRVPNHDGFGRRDNFPNFEIKNKKFEGPQRNYFGPQRRGNSQWLQPRKRFVPPRHQRPRFGPENRPNNFRQSRPKPIPDSELYTIPKDFPDQPKDMQFPDPPTFEELQGNPNIGPPQHVSHRNGPARLPPRHRNNRGHDFPEHPGSYGERRLPSTRGFDSNRPPLNNRNFNSEGHRDQYPRHNRHFDNHKRTDNEDFPDVIKYGNPYSQRRENIEEYPNGRRFGNNRRHSNHIDYSSDNDFPNANDDRRSNNREYPRDRPHGSSGHGENTRHDEYPGEYRNEDESSNNDDYNPDEYEQDRSHNGPRERQSQQWNSQENGDPREMKNRRTPPPNQEYSNYGKGPTGSGPIGGGLRGGGPRGGPPRGGGGNGGPGESHQGQGRKPPNFDKFPFSFLPKHLMGPFSQMNDPPRGSSSKKNVSKSENGNLKTNQESYNNRNVAANNSAKDLQEGLNDSVNAESQADRSLYAGHTNSYVDDEFSVINKQQPRKPKKVENGKTQAYREKPVITESQIDNSTQKSKYYKGIEHFIMDSFFPNLLPARIKTHRTRRSIENNAKDIKHLSSELVQNVTGKGRKDFTLYPRIIEIVTISSMKPSSSETNVNISNPVIMDDGKYYISSDYEPEGEIGDPHDPHEHLHQKLHYPPGVLYRESFHQPEPRTSWPWQNSRLSNKQNGHNAEYVYHYYYPIHNTEDRLNPHRNKVEQKKAHDSYLARNVYDDSESDNKSGYSSLYGSNHENSRMEYISPRNGDTHVMQSNGGQRGYVPHGYSEEVHDIHPNTRAPYDKKNTQYHPEERRSFYKYNKGSTELRYLGEHLGRVYQTGNELRPLYHGEMHAGPRSRPYGSPYVVTEPYERKGVHVNHYDSHNHDYNGVNMGDKILSAMFKAKRNIRSRLKSESYMAQKMYHVVDSMPFRYVSAFMGAKPYAKYVSHAGMYMWDALKIMKDRDGMNHADIEARISEESPRREYMKPLTDPGIPDAPMPMPPDIDYCPYPHKYVCDESFIYRSFDGSCNNPQDPIIGRSLTPHKRFLPPHYGDGIMTSRVSVVDGSPLPASRLVSIHMFPDIDRPARIHTHMLMIFGQFMDHDLTRTAITEIAMDESGFGETEEVKCGYDGCDTGKPGLEACWPIPIPDHDPDFRYNRCLKFVRSQGTPPLKCNFGPREQMNQVTPWMDASQVYGSTKEEADSLREYADPRRGRLRITPHPHGQYYKPLLPQDDVDLCRDTNHTTRCFKAGDERVNEQVGLTAMHTIWLRHHNRIEDRLHELNPHWTGERLYQESRKIVGAILQHIVYNEYLPLVVGRQYGEKYDIILTDGYSYGGYNPDADGRIINEFATAAFRFGHTLIQDRFRLSSPDFEADDTMMLSMAFRRPEQIYDTARGGVDSVLRGLCDYPMQSYDHFFTKQITRSLFTEDPPFGPGMDLLSLNLQRGRDHGLRGYNDYREFCGLRKAGDFDDLESEIPDPMTRGILKKLYKSVDDIDLFVGGIAERSVDGGVVGPTFACIISQQFKDLRAGDRFWYENDNDVGFTAGQIRQIKKVSLAKVMCLNGDYINKIQPWVLLKPFRDIYSDSRSASYDSERGKLPFGDFATLYDNDFNARVPCDTLPDIDYRFWQQVAPHGEKK